MPSVSLCRCLLTEGEQELQPKQKLDMDRKGLACSFSSAPSLCLSLSFGDPHGGQGACPGCVNLTFRERWRERHRP